jgi:hypothetical protein
LAAGRRVWARRSLCAMTIDDGTYACRNKQQERVSRTPASRRRIPTGRHGVDGHTATASFSICGTLPGWFQHGTDRTDTIGRYGSSASSPVTVLGLRASKNGDLSLFMASKQRSVYCRHNSGGRSFFRPRRHSGDVIRPHVGRAPRHYHRSRHPLLATADGRRKRGGMS